MWGKRTRPKAVPDDVGEARTMRVRAAAQLRAAQRQAPFVQKMTDALIDRQGKNHYIELLYHHTRGAS